MNGSRLAELREAAGLSQAELSRRCGLNQSFISRLEAGRVTNPTRSTYKKLADALGKSLMDFMIEMESAQAATSVA